MIEGDVTEVCKIMNGLEKKNRDVITVFRKRRRGAASEVLGEYFCHTAYKFSSFPLRAKSWEVQK